MQNSRGGQGRSGRNDRERNKLGFNISEESILPLQSNAVTESNGIVKTTQVSVRSTPVDDGRRRSVEDRV